MSQQIVIFGGSFNPPGLHHRRIAQALAEQFDLVIIVPCGPRPDKQSSNDVDPIFRATLASICFAGLPRVEVDLADLEQAAFSHTGEIDARYAARGDVWHLVSADMVTDGAAGDSFIHKVLARRAAALGNAAFRRRRARRQRDRRRGPRPAAAPPARQPTDRRTFQHGHPR